MDPRDPTIRFCVNNPRTLSERNELIARGFDCRDCLSNCTQCFETRFLLINDEIVAGDSYDSMIASPRCPEGDPATGE